MTPQELKNSILQLAIQGRLVEQRPEEGAAEPLYQRIQEERRRLIQEGTVKKEKPLPEITEEEKPFEIPEGWMWVRLGALIHVLGGVSYKKSDVSNSGIRILRGGNIQNMKIRFDESDVFLPLSYEDAGRELREGDVVIVASTGSKAVIGKPGYVERDLKNTTAGAFLRICRPYLLCTKLYLKIIFESDFYRKHIRDLSQGTNINNIKESYITEFTVPLPPLAEQTRITAKIEELLPSLDRYERAWNRLEAFHQKFPADMRKSLLQWAIQGKLVEQRPEEGTGEALYQQIQEEKRRLIQEGRIKKEKPLPEIAEEEKPFEIPKGWTWCRLGNILHKLTDGAHATPQYTTNGVPFLSVKDISSGKLDFSSCKYISEQDHRELYARCNPEYGDLLLSKIGTTGIPVIVDTDQQFSLFVSVALLKFNQNLICGKFLQALINSPLVQTQAAKNTRGVGNKNWVIRDIAHTVMVLPPLAEQKRIAAKLEELLPLCEGLR